jgi:spermidine dehydrogenase
MSKPEDKDLGMDRGITRRDFLNGAAVTIGATLLPGGANAQTSSPEFVEPPPPPGKGADVSAQEPLLAEGITQQDPRYYPPALTGMRGSHPGSFEAGHSMRREGHFDTSRAEKTGEHYDLVVVGAGMSGLSAAYFFVKNVGRSARVLVLDNHDDFGGHAKRNEFRYNGRLLVLNGGTLNIESPPHYNAPAKQLLSDIGIDIPRYLESNAQNRQLYSSLGLRSSYFFDKETWGEDQLVVGGGRDYGPNPHGMTAAFLAKTPLPEQARKDVLRLYDPGQPDYMAGLTSAQKKLRLAKMSYKEYLLNVAKVDRHAMWFFQARPQGLFCVGIDAVPALFCWEMGGYPGFDGLHLDPTPDGVLGDLPGGSHGRQKPIGGGEVHFPDGNATIARLLVRWLVPEAVPGTTMESVGTARVNYPLLDRPDQTARVRLNSTVVNVSQDGDPEAALQASVTYLRGGKAYQVTAKACVMACWNMFIPFLCPQLPEKQKEALAYGIKRPIVYTNVAIRNWTSFQKLGISSVSTPTMYHTGVQLAEAVTLGELEAPQTPEEPIVLHMGRMPCSPGHSMKEQHVIGRFELFNTSFETFERNIRDQLGRILSPGGFDPARDIVGISVNRWPHGYAYSYNSLEDPMEWVYTDTPTRPCVAAREPFGCITIANSDAEASSHTDAAMLAAYKAVCYALDRRAMPLLA